VGYFPRELVTNFPHEIGHPKGLQLQSMSEIEIFAIGH
jgi:hypothetical protein